jgi:hypothetical protein
MHGNLTGDETRATNPNASACGELQDSALLGWFAHLCRYLWPTKPWLRLMQLLGVKERTAHNYASGAHPPSGETFLKLLWSDDGYRALKFVMSLNPNPPTWWVNVEHALEIKQAIDSVAVRAAGGESQNN